MSAPAGRLQQALVVTGGVALLGAMVIEALAVLGRHVGMPLLGSIELVQAAVLVSGSAALLLATVAQSHAQVHLVVDRLPPPLRELLHRSGRLLGAVLFLALFAGSWWIAADLWNGHEESELLRVPYRPLRLLVVFTTVAVAAVFAVQALRSRRG